jgi:hypothetical protein
MPQNLNSAPLVILPVIVHDSTDQSNNDARVLINQVV